ncbi:hypothetical protein ASJ81_10190 [Methanosarcina spelaei]|uniref:Peptidase M48 domain-containing protein n=1 Tax=Methanosarcina spelaei TaxID=1036679 RepID=A0A2A2HQA4_9EURY|nr:zinc metalloprotease HtpX [Methanosarcina spelaei]PAV11488.1 hypothetical protein ASJ81_10190 [Methanosarcina spelaei]
MDFIKSLIRSANIPLCIYLVLNTFIVTFVLGSLFGGISISTLLLGLGTYAISLAIALSPFGERVLRKQSGCTEIKRKDQLDYIEPIFKEVLEKARNLDSSIPLDVKLYMKSSEDVNAFATGRKTVCVTEGMLNAPKEQIKATLAHEMGHIAHKDTDLILLVSVGNYIVTFIFISMRLIARFTKFIGSFGGDKELNLAGRASDMVIAVFLWAWTKIGIMLVMKSSRNNEFEADKFAFKLGYGNALCELLDSFTGTSTKGLFANLMNSHPDKNDRIAALMNLGATYSKSYGAN